MYKFCETPWNGRFLESWEEFYQEVALDLRKFSVCHTLSLNPYVFLCSTQMFDFASSYTSSIHEMQNVRAFNSYNFLIHTFLEYHVPKRPLMVDSRMVMLPITAKPTHASSYYGCHECIIITAQFMALLVGFLKRAPAPASQEALPNEVYLKMASPLKPPRI